MVSSVTVLRISLLSIRCKRYVEMQSKMRFITNTPNYTQTAEIPARSSTNQATISILLQRYGFTQSQIHDFIEKNKFLINYEPSDVEKCVSILSSLNLPQNAVVSIIRSCPRVLELKFVRKWHAALSKLGFCSLSSKVVKKVVEEAWKFKLEPHGMLKGVQVMRCLGFSEETISVVIEELPLVYLSKNSSGFKDHICLLKDAAGIKSNEGINRICGLFPGFFMLNLDFHLRLLFQELGELRFTKEEVRNVLLEEPRMLLIMEVGEMSRYVDLLSSLKCRKPIKERILSKGHVMACLGLKIRVELLCWHGLIRRDAFKILFVEPRTIIYSVEDIERKIDFLLHKLDFHIEYLIDCPEYLGVHLEKHIIPRYEVIEHLKSQGGLSFNVGMKHLVKVSKLRFYNMFVKPYPECEKIFNGLNKEGEVKSRHPAGLWKLFMPQKYSDTAKDVENMKLFMETMV